MEWLQDLISNLPQYLEIASYIIVAATAITSMTKTKSDDKVVNFIKKILNFLAGNFGKNKNADS